MHKFAKLFLTVLIIIAGASQLKASNTNDFWSLQPDGSILWKIDERIPHYEHIEMSGKMMSVVLYYGVTPDGSFTFDRAMVWPMLRTVPNDTHASLIRNIDLDIMHLAEVNTLKVLHEKVDSIRIKGMVTVYSSWRDNISLIREYIPTTDLPALVEKYKIVNNGSKTAYVTIPKLDNEYRTPPEKGVNNASYRIKLNIQNSGTYTLKPGEAVEFGATVVGYRPDQPELAIDIDEEKAKRMSLVDFWMNNLVLETPDPIIDRMQAFSKIRALESIYATKGGPLHGPGGERYYAAIWANDQAEYINPYFPFTGYEYGNASALNAYMLFSRYINDDYNPIPSSIIAEGDDTWAGAGDRGDAAMVAYGASRYVLARGSKSEAEQLWPLISWCLEYCHRKLNEGGVVASRCDELEGRFPAGKANLCTSSLYYDALISASYLAKILGKGGSSTYLRQAKELRKNIETYFGANVQGYDTYAYYKGNDVLRAWICIPLTMGIYERAKGTTEALFSPLLWTENGLLTQAGTKDFWDRSTLYALRGAFAAGETENALEHLRKYSEKRLLGDHVPYAIEAWPEGGQRHLSAESGLYGRIFTEGMFGIRPTGFKSFTLTPRLPQEWDHMNLRKIHAFDSSFDIEVARQDDNHLKVNIIQGDTQKGYTIKPGDTIKVRLK